MDTFTVEIVKQTSEVAVVKVKSRSKEGLPRYSPSFVCDVMCSVRTDLGIDPLSATFAAQESEGLQELNLLVVTY